jgi:transcriptional/translational regulatory protein YebC/TACO1
VIGRFEDLEALQGGLRGLGLPVGSWEHRWMANTLCRLEDAEVLRGVLRMLDAFEELDDVRSVNTNLEADEGLMEALIT